MGVHYTWGIDELPTTNNWIKSPVFYGSAGGRPYAWCLSLLRREIWSKEAISVGLWVKGDLHTAVKVRVQFSIVDPSGVPEKQSVPKKYTIWPWDMKSTPHEHCYDEFLNNVVLKRRGPRLLFHCCAGDGEPMTCPVLKVPENPFAKFWELYQQQKSCDFTIQSCSKKFGVHKHVLAARSEVFAAMIEHDLIEKQTSTVTIDDVDPVVVEEMIHFIYLNVVNHYELSLDLLACAERYQLEKLKSLCALYLLDTMSVRSAAEILVAAHIYSIPYLKTAAISFITEEWKGVQATEGWKEVLKHEDLAEELIGS